MTCCKIIQDGKVVSAGRVFLKWNAKRSKLYVCDVNDAQYIQTFDEANIYHADWFRAIPQGAPVYEDAEAVVISLQEYEDLIQQLKEHEPVALEQTIPEPVQEDVEKPEEEQVMSIAEMREMIINQQKQIDALIGSLK